jgi:hypothetical protein
MEPFGRCGSAVFPASFGWRRSSIFGEAEVANPGYLLLCTVEHSHTFAVAYWLFINLCNSPGLYDIDEKVNIGQ